MKFSVITPTYNNLDKLKRCVGSVRGQMDVDYEHLIQDGGSSDGTQNWLQLNDDIDWQSEKDNGMYAAINKGWQRASGDILSWLNSDEQYLPGTLKKVERYFSLNPDIDFLYGDALVINTDGSLIAARREIRLSPVYIKNSFLNAFSCTFFFRRRLFDQGLLNFDERYKYAADMDMILRLLSEGTRYDKINDYLAAFTLDGTNLSCHQGMLDETTDIQRRYGGYRTHLLRKMVMMGRYVERYISGSYRRVNVEYQYCINEIPEYKIICGNSIPGSYKTR